MCISDIFTECQYCIQDSLCCDKSIWYYINHLSAKGYVRTVKQYEHKLRFRANWDIFTRIKNVAYRNLQDMLGFAHKNKEWIKTYFDDADFCVNIFFL